MIFDFNSSSGTPVSSDVSAIVDSFAIASSKSIDAATAAVPTPVIAAVTGAKAFPADCIPSPTLVIFSPAFDSLSPASVTAAPTFSNAVFSFSSCASKFFSSVSVFVISVCRARYLFSSISPRSKAADACSCAVFSVCNFSFVVSIDFDRISCFCDSNSVFLGSSFKA